MPVLFAQLLCSQRPYWIESDLWMKDWWTERCNPSIRGSCSVASVGGSVGREGRAWLGSLDESLWQPLGFIIPQKLMATGVDGTWKEEDFTYQNKGSILLIVSYVPCADFSVFLFRLHLGFKVSINYSHYSLGLALETSYLFAVYVLSRRFPITSYPRGT